MLTELRRAVPEIFNPESGRVDGMRVAEFLHLQARDVGEIVGCSAAELRRAPDAPPWQEALEKVAVIVAGLLDATGGDKRSVLIWLNAPHPMLDDDSPLDLMRGDEIDVVVELVDDILSGAPA